MPIEVAVEHWKKEIDDKRKSMGAFISLPLIDKLLKNTVLVVLVKKVYQSKHSFVPS